MRASRRGRRHRLLLALVALALAGCAARVPRESPADGALLFERDALLQAWPVWSFDGRIAVHDGSEGGSGRIQWREGGGYYEVTVRAPVSATTWILSGDPVQAELRGAGPEPARGIDAEELLARETGWRLPVAQARAWVRGLAFDPARARLTAARGGLPATLEEDGWRVEFGEWAPPSGDRPAMPRRITARRATWEVRLAIANWSLERGG